MKLKGEKKNSINKEFSVGERNLDQGHWWITDTSTLEDKEVSTLTIRYIEKQSQISDKILNYWFSYDFVSGNLIQNNFINNITEYVVSL